MLPKKYRLKKYSAFIATYKLNNTISDDNVCIFFGKNKTDEKVPTKFAFVVSKKIHKRAVVRNHIKRLMRESVKKIFLNSEYNFLHSYVSIIFVAKKASVNSCYSDILSSLSDLLTQKPCK